MESIDFSCFCGVLQEHIHWTWGTPGGGKMGARRGPAPVATYAMNPWAPALTLPAGSSQGPLPKQITGVNLHEVVFWEMHHVEVALLVVRGSQGSAGWSLQPGLSSPLQKLCTLSVWSTSWRRARLLVCGH